MKALKNGVIRYWIMTGMLIACLICAGGFFAMPVIMQLIEIHKAEVMQIIPEPPLNADKNFIPPQE